MRRRLGRRGRVGNRDVEEDRLVVRIPSSGQRHARRWWAWWRGRRWRRGRLRVDCRVRPCTEADAADHQEQAAHDAGKFIIEGRHAERRVVDLPVLAIVAGLGWLGDGPFERPTLLRRLRGPWVGSVRKERPVRPRRHGCTRSILSLLGVRFISTSMRPIHVQTGKAKRDVRRIPRF